MDGNFLKCYFRKKKKILEEENLNFNFFIENNIKSYNVKIWKEYRWDVDNIIEVWYVYYKEKLCFFSFLLSIC